MAGLLPLVGRDRELAELHRLIAEAGAGNGALVLLGGEAGIGKTALLDAALAAAGAAQSAVWAHAPGPGETPSLGPWREAAAALAPEAPFSDWAAPEAALRLAAWLGGLGRPAVIAFEDLQWADDASLGILRQIAPRLARRPVVILATYRSDEAGPGHQLWTLLPELQRTGGTHIHLERLTPGAVAELAAAALPGAPGLTGLADYLYQRTGGHPLFARELLTAYVRTGRTLPEEGPLPITVQQAVDRKLSRLSPGARAILQAAAVIGERFPYSMLARVADAREPELLAALEEALALRIIREEAAESLTFDHALIRSALSSQVPGPRRRLWHLRTAEALLSVPSPDPDMAAFHLDRAGDERAPALLLAAGDRSRRLGAPGAARERYERALALLPSGHPLRPQLMLKLGHAAPDQARPLWEQAIAAGDRATALWARHSLALWLHGQGDPTSLPVMEAVLAQQEELLGDAGYLRLEADLYGRPAGYPRIAGSLVLAQAKAGQQAAARTLLDSLYARAQPEARRTELIAVEYWLATYTGRTEEALHLGQQASDAALRQGNWPGALDLESNRLYQALLAHGDHPEHVDAVAAHVSELLAETARRLRLDLQAEGFPPLGWYQFLRGDWDGAMQNLVEHMRRRPEVEEPGVRGFAITLLLARGDVAGARALLAPVAPFRPDDPAPLHSMAISACNLRAELAMAEGQLELAGRWLEAGARLLAERKQLPFRSSLRLAWARLHLRSGRPEEACRTAAEALEAATESKEFRFRIMASLTSGEAATAAGRQAEAAAHLGAALEMAERCRFPYYAALARLGLAGAGRATRQELEAARETFARLGAAPALAHAEELLARFGGATLTQRELEVARLVAEGMSDKEVAARLFLSPRTVDGHLRNIFNKLGMSSRAGLAVYIARGRF